MLTLNDALRHLGYDEVDDTIKETVTDELAEARVYLQGTVGKDIFDLLPDDQRIDILLKAYLDDIHDERGTTSAKAGNAKRSMILSTENQLRLDLVELREEASGS